MRLDGIKDAQKRAAQLFQVAGISITRQEKENIEVTDMGLGDINVSGLNIITYVNNDCYCAKELALLPFQTCPEHRHPPITAGDVVSMGKMETFRCRWGEVFLYVEGPPTSIPIAVVPAGSERYYTVFHEIKLMPGNQYTIPPNTKHWFQAGQMGAVISEFSSTSRDEFDLFTDPRVRRV